MRGVVRGGVPELQRGRSINSINAPGRASRMGFGLKCLFLFGFLLSDSGSHPPPHEGRHRTTRTTSQTRRFYFIKITTRFLYAAPFSALGCQPP